MYLHVDFFVKAYNDYLLFPIILRYSYVKKPLYKCFDMSVTDESYPCVMCFRTNDNFHCLRFSLLSFYSLVYSKFKHVLSNVFMYLDFFVKAYYDHLLFPIILRFSYVKKRRYVFIWIKTGSVHGQEITINKGNSSIPLFKTHKSMDKKRNRGNKLKLRETH